MGTAADHVNKLPDLFARSGSIIPDVRSFPLLFRGGCATFYLKENLVGSKELIHTAIRPQSHFNPLKKCLPSSILLRLKLVG